MFRCRRYATVEHRASQMFGSCPIPSDIELCAAVMSQSAASGSSEVSAGLSTLAISSKCVCPVFHQS